MTLPGVIAAMIRSVPCGHTGQRSMSMANTRLRHRAQLQCGEGELASGSSTPCWRGVGVMDPRSVLWGAQHPP